MSTSAQSIQALNPSAPPGVISAIRQASASTGVDFDYLLQQAASESSFDPKAQASTSSARGLYQFIDSTWLDLIDKHGSKHGMEALAGAITRDASGKPTVTDPDNRQAILALRDNPGISALMAAEFALDNKQCLEGSLGRKVGSTELYMAHFLGAGGATRFLSELAENPGCDGASVLPTAAKANEAVFFSGGQSRSVDEIYAQFADRFSAPVSSPDAGSGPFVAQTPPATNPDLRQNTFDAQRPSSTPHRDQSYRSENRSQSHILTGKYDSGSSFTDSGNALSGLNNLQRADMHLMSLRLLQSLPAADNLLLGRLREKT